MAAASHDAALDAPHVTDDAGSDATSADSHTLCPEASLAYDSSLDTGAGVPDAALDAAEREANASLADGADVPIEGRGQETLSDASTQIPADAPDGRVASPDLTNDQRDDGQADGAPDTTADAPADAAAIDGGESTSDAPEDAGEADSGVQGPTWLKIAGLSPQHHYPAVAYDPTLQRAVLFGGHTTCSENLASDQTWEWDGAAWTSVAPSGTIPSPRGAVSMAFDLVTGEALIHGGWAPPGSIQPGNYSYNLATHTWTTRGSPSVVLGWYALGYDSDAGLVRMFAGSDGYYFYRQVGTWDTTNVIWSGVEPAGPSVRARHNWVFDQAHHRFVMFGGVPNWSGSHLSDTWEYDPAANAWKQTATKGTRPLDCDVPPPMAYDPHRELVVMYCHTNGGETWEYDAGTHAWSKPAVASELGVITGASLFYDMKLQSVLLVGGCKSGSLQGETWQYTPSR